MTNLNYTEMREAARKQVLERREAGLRLYWDPAKLPERVLAEDAVEGKTVAEWSATIDALEEREVERMRAKGTNLVIFEKDGSIVIPAKPFPIIDLVTLFPPRVSALVTRWKELGKPTKFTDTATVLARLRGEAETAASFATLQETEAQKHDDLGHTEVAKKHRKYAATQRAKADKLLAEAAEVETRYRKENP